MGESERIREGIQRGWAVPFGVALVAMFILATVGILTPGFWGWAMLAITAVYLAATSWAVKKRREDAA